MIKRFRFGNPIATDTVTKEIPITELPVDYFKYNNESKPSFTYQMKDEDIVYGLGENMRGINKRGFTYISRCMDGAKHTEDRNSLYAAHNFIIIDGEEKFGVFVDASGIVTFDVGETVIGELVISLKENMLKI